MKLVAFGVGVVVTPWVAATFLPHVILPMCVLVAVLGVLLYRYAIFLGRNGMFPTRIGSAIWLERPDGWRPPPRRQRLRRRLARPRRGRRREITPTPGSGAGQESDA